MVQYSFSLENFEIFILILVRVSCFVYIAPFYGMSNVPNQVKIGLSAMIALLALRHGVFAVFFIKKV